MAAAGGGSQRRQRAAAAGGSGDVCASSSNVWRKWQDQRQHSCVASNCAIHCGRSLLSPYRLWLGAVGLLLVEDAKEYTMQQSNIGGKKGDGVMYITWTRGKEDRDDKAR